MLRCGVCRRRSLLNKRQIKDTVFAAYGGYVCSCCGNDDEQLLQIDHKDNDGAAHRKILGRGIYRRLFDDGFPAGYQVLCVNCNVGKHLNGGICPHKGRLEIPRKAEEQTKDSEALCCCGRRYATVGYKTCRPCRGKSARSHYAAKDRAFLAYGGYVCSCCGEETREFLQIDHICGGGQKHMRVLGGGSTRFYRWLKAKGFPDGYRVLCANCNRSSYLNGDCRCQVVALAGVLQGAMPMFSAGR